MKVVQIVPEVTVGRGVEAVAFHLEQEWRAVGVEVSRFTLADAHGVWLPAPAHGPLRHLAHAACVVWFSTVGTVLATRMLRRDPELVSICHNDALVGDVYVNHGILTVAMRARGRFWYRMLRNPLHLFTWARDHWRYGHRAHRVVVNLTGTEDEALRAAFPRLAIPTTVIGNGVDIDRYRPPTPDERAAARAALALPDGAFAAVFVGHEFERKGLPLIFQAMAALGEEVHLIVVGGSPEAVAAAERRAASLELAGRTHFVGQQADPRPYFHAADALAFPSAYEAHALVVLEALACGLPVVATAVGCVPDVIEEGVTGHIVPADALSLRSALVSLAAADRSPMAVAARHTAEQHSWPAVAAAYLDLFRRLRPA